MSNALILADVRLRLTPAPQGVPVQWPNTLFDLPPSASPFLTVEIAGGISRPITLGGVTWEAAGQVWVHIMVPVDTGADVAFALVDAITIAFRTGGGGPVIYDRIEADPGGPAEENGLYWRTSVSVDWRLQTIIGA